MLHEFIRVHRHAIIERTRQKLAGRIWPPVSTEELDHGVPLFLTQLTETLRLEATNTPFSPGAIGESATRHGGELLGLGFNVSQVVHDYGDICQAITEIALEQQAPITTLEFHTLNRCLDSAIADAVTEHARLTAESWSASQLEREGQVAHEQRNLLETALIAFHTLQRGTVAINGSTGAVLWRSLTGLKHIVDSHLADIRISANLQRRERIGLRAFLDDIRETASLQAEYRGQQFILDPVDGTMAIHGDPQLLTSAITNLVNNAFKFTPPGGRVTLRAHAGPGRIRIEVEDECGGIPHTTNDPFKPFGERRGDDRSGLGLGLSIARKAARAHDGDIEVRNMCGKGCVFAIDLPTADTSHGAPP